MGSGASRQVPQSTLRKFPNRPPGSTIPSRPPPSSNPAAVAASRQPPSAQPKIAHVSYAKDEATRKDGLDPDMPFANDMIRPEFARRLGQIGVVQPNPTFSPSSTASPSMPTFSHAQEAQNSGPIFPSTSNNLVLSALEARQRIEFEAEQEFQNLGLASSQGRRFLPAGMIRDILVMRERGARDQHVENRFNLSKGVMDKLGPQGLYKPAGAAPPSA